MEKAKLIALLEKYWQAETTVEEEEALAAYFREQTEPDNELLPYRDLFAYYAEEARVSAGPDFGERILRHLGIPADGQPATVQRVHSFRWGLVAAAAAIVLVVGSVFLLQPGDERETSAGPAEIASVRDTYDDPQQALAAVRHALLIASTQLNKGRQQIIGSPK